MFLQKIVPVLRVHNKICPLTSTMDFLNIKIPPTSDLQRTVTGKREFMGQV